MSETFKRTLWKTYPQPEKPEPPSLPRRDHPALEFLFALDDAMDVCRLGMAFIKEQLGQSPYNLYRSWFEGHSESDRQWLAFADANWNRDLDNIDHQGLVSNYIKVFRAADVLSHKLETMDKSKMPPRLRGSLERFVARLPKA